MEENNEREMDTLRTVYPKVYSSVLEKIKNL